MLTATYSLVTIAAEQNVLRRNLHRLQECIHHAWETLHKPDLTSLESAFQNLTQFDHDYQRRKVERHLIPALRNVTDEADSLLAELDHLSSTGLNLLHSVGELLVRAFEGGMVRITEVCNAMEMYCHKLLDRLAKEEEELIPLARRVFSVEQWFSVAEKFMREDRRPRDTAQKQSPHILPLAPGLKSVKS
jgi:hypothetical protein